MRKAPRTALVLGSATVAAALVLSGCSGGSTGGGGDSGTVSQDDIDKAMTTPTELTFWTWVPDIQNEVDLFEAKYPDIKVTFKIDADASKKEIEALVAQSQKRSAVYDVITNPVNVTVEVL